MRKLISLVLTAALSGALLCVPALADNAVVITSSGVSMEERADANIAAEDAAAMADAGLSTSVPASTAPTAEQAAIDEAAAGVPSQEEAPSVVQPPVQQDPQLPFTDVPSTSPYYTHILYAFQHDLFRGYADSTFRPETGMTRAMFVTVLYRQASQLSQDMVVHTRSSFTDIANSNAEFQTAIHWAAERGIVNGKSAYIFAPNEQVSRQQACAIIVRYLRDFLHYDLSAFQTAVSFADEAQISSYAKEPVTIAMNMSLIDAAGTDSSGQRVFSPWREASRAVVAKVMAVTTAKIPDLTVAAEPVIPSADPAVTPEVDPSAGNSGGGSTGGGSTGGGSTGGGSTGGDTPAPVTHTAEEIAQETAVIGYMREFVDKYERYIISNSNVKACFEALIPTLRDAVAAHDNGAFVDRAYAEAHYSDQAALFRSRYSALSDVEKALTQQYVLVFANTTSKVMAILDFFGVSTDSLI